MAGPFTRADFDKLVPADKKLTPEWVKSLTARGEREVYRGADLAKIGMPVGGICAGQLYLGGDGKLWHWDLFNTRIGTGAEHYAKPLEPTSPLEQGFALRIVSGDKSRNARWIGRIGAKSPSPANTRSATSNTRTRTRRSTCSLEAFSPFIPLNTDDSSLPATVMQFTVKNHGSTEVEAELAGWLENAICLHSAKAQDGLRRNRLVRDNDLLFLECSAEDAAARRGSRAARHRLRGLRGRDLRQLDGHWHRLRHGAGGDGEDPRLPGRRSAAKGKRVVNSHASAPGNSVEEKDAATGTLVSRPFTIERELHHVPDRRRARTRTRPASTSLVDDKVVLTATGSNENQMHPLSWDVRKWAGKTGRLQIVDDATGGWGNIGVDDIVFSDKPREPVGPLKPAGGFRHDGPRPAGPAAGLISSRARRLPVHRRAGGRLLARPMRLRLGLAKKGFGEKLIGSLTRKLKLKPGDSATAVFVLSWHLPNLKMNRLPPGRHYAARFDSALAVARYVRQNFARLSGETRLWHDTWYDGSLPWWFLDRTFLNTSILATSTCYRFGDGRFYGWEGVGCCEGTCGHVWQYAHAVARLFPDLERMTREKVDFGLALQPDGAIHFRGEFNDIPAIDAQAGTILRALREHQMSADSEFLKRNWPQHPSGRRVADRQGRQRRRPHREQPAQHARHGLVWAGGLAERPLPRRPARRRTDGD